MKSRSSLMGMVGTILTFLALLLGSRSAAAEVRCDGVTPAEVKATCGANVHVVPGATQDVSEKDCSRLLSSDDNVGAARESSPVGLSVHVIKSMAPLTQDSKWAHVKSVPGFDAGFSYEDEVSPGEIVTVVAASRGGLTASVNLLGKPSICTVDQAIALLNFALPPASAESRGTAFESSGNAPPMRDGAKLLVTAYAIIWILVTCYLGYLWNAQKGLSARIDGLERASDRAERAEAQKKPATKSSPKKDLEEEKS
ncbi:hypothetical protein BH09MYX1_BH09MYX1_45840 [soil metagenome]